MCPAFSYLIQVKNSHEGIVGPLLTGECQDSWNRNPFPFIVYGTVVNKCFAASQ